MQRLLLLAALAWSVSAPATPWPGAELARERARAAAPAIASDRFVTEPTIAALRLAPDGRSIAWLERRTRGRRLWRMDLASGKRQVLLPHTTATNLLFARNARWLFLTGASEIWAVSTVGSSGGGPLGDRFGGTTRLLGADPWHPAALLLVERAAGGASTLWRVGPGGLRQPVAASRLQLIDVAVDGHGRVAFAKLVAGDAHEIRARLPGGGFRTALRCVDLHRCRLYGAARDGSSGLIATDLDSGRLTLETIDRNGRRKPVAGGSDPDADLAGVLLDPRSDRPLAVRFTWQGWRPLPGANVPPIPFAARDLEAGGGGLLANLDEARRQGRAWHWRGRELLADRGRGEAIPSGYLASQFPITLTMSDGMAIHALLTVPPGRDLARAPMAVLVHGGPWAHDEPGYSATVQLLANRGFIVVQPQFRGSTGFGRAYLRAAAGDFGDGRVQQDIEDSARQLHRRGIGDPARTAIVGASFGGYSVLQALSKPGSPFRAGVAMVPPSELGWTMRWAAARGDIGEAEGVPFATVLRSLGLDSADPAIAERLARQSPLARPDALARPLLLLAGGRDERVPVRSVVAYAAALRRADAPATVMIARKAGHRAEEAAARRATLHLIDRFLAHQFDLAEPGEPGSTTRAWLRRNLPGWRDSSARQVSARS